jgi:hypothetical protein
LPEVEVVADEVETVLQELALLQVLQLVREPY